MGRHVEFYHFLVWHWNTKWVKVLRYNIWDCQYSMSITESISKRVNNVTCFFYFATYFGSNLVSFWEIILCSSKPSLVFSVFCQGFYGFIWVNNIQADWIIYFYLVWNFKIANKMVIVFVHFVCVSKGVFVCLLKSLL